MHGPSITERIQRAAALCLAGRHADALTCVSPAVDAADIDDAVRAQALHVAAASSLGLGRMDDAERDWRRAAAAAPGYADAYTGLAALYQSLGRLPDAETAYRAWLAADPAHADARHGLAAVLHALGRTDEAEAACRQALAIRADHTDTHCTLGAVLHGARRLPDAEAAYRRALALSPQHAVAHHGLGNVLRDLGRVADADAAYRQALAVRPQFPEALANLGSLLLAQNRLAEAELACRLAVTIRPAFADAHVTLGAVLAACKRWPEAERAYRDALALRADHAHAHYNLGVALHALDRLADAEAAYRDAIRCRPGLVEAHNNLGCVLRALDRLPDAADAFSHALALNPALAEAHYNVGSVLAQQGRRSDAEAAYRRALALRADYPDAAFALGVLLLGDGRYDEGWRHYESRYDHADLVHRRARALLSCPQWRGDALAGRSVLVWQEDGLGDMIQFSRYVPLLKAQGAARIELACVSPLHRLLARLDGVDAVLDHDAALARAPHYDCWTSLLSVPRHLRTRIDTIPPPAGLTCDPPLAARWRARLDALPPGPRIGVVWKGNPRHHNDAHRSLPALSALAPLWRVPGVAFVSLQKGQGEDEALAPPAGQPLVHLGSDVTDLADTAAIVAQLDLVICVDTSIAHLAASLGTPCWVLLPARDVDWRWLHGRDDSPWYPDAVRLFRREPDEPWDAALERVRLACVERFAIEA